MASKTKKRKEKANKKEDQHQPAKELSDAITRTIVSFLTLCKEVSLIGFIIVSVACLVFFWGSPEQKMAIIDKYILFQSSNGHVLCTAIIVALTAVLTIEFVFYRKMLRVERKEVKRLSDWKTEQQNIFAKPLNSSK
jgi:hypothetical protein